MINNRQAGRRRGRGGGNNNGPRQGGQQGNGSRIDSRARGNASQLYEKYKNMAADAQRAGDRVNTEYYLQFADHYFRVLSEQRGRFEDQQQPRRMSNEFDMDGPDENGDEFGDEGEPIRGNEQADAPRYDGQERGQERGQDRGQDRNRDDRPREFRRDDGGEGRRPAGDAPRREWQDRDRPDRERVDRDRPDRERNDGNRADGGRYDGSRADRQRERRPVEAAGDASVGGQHRADAIAPGESLTARAENVIDADRPLDAPRRRGRPRREAAPVEGGADQGEAADTGLSADRLPPSLTVAANDEGPAEAKPPRRRRARPADETPTAAE